jgi:CheY-like chemotaxis protein
MHSKSILVVEDDPSIREVMKDVLELSGYRVVTAANGREGYEILKRGEKPGVVFLDLMMPVMDGWEFMANRKTDSELSRIPVVVLTASQYLPQPEGASHYLAKPLELETLLSVARNYCIAKAS